MRTLHHFSTECSKVSHSAKDLSMGLSMSFDLFQENTSLMMAEQGTD